MDSRDNKRTPSHGKDKSTTKNTFGFLKSREKSVSKIRDSKMAETKCTRVLRSASRLQKESDCSLIKIKSNENKEDWKKTIMIGTNYQAEVPKVCSYNETVQDEPRGPCENKLWDPSHISEEVTKEFLKQVQIQNGSLPAGSHVRDDEQALHLLMQCNYNCEEALKQCPMDLFSLMKGSSSWSEEECKNFEIGLRANGKNFHLIQKRVKTRSVGEVVHFYYLWKKTKRHDMYKAELREKKFKLKKKKTKDGSKKEDNFDDVDLMELFLKE